MRVGILGTGAVSRKHAEAYRHIERQFLDFGSALQDGRPPLVSGEEGYRALALVDAVYRSCREGRRVAPES